MRKPVSHPDTPHLLKITADNKEDVANLITGRKNNELIFLLGSGASVEAGMPTVAQLTKELKNSLPTLLDVNGVQRPEYGEVFDLFEKNSGWDAKNYEKFFEWINALLEVNKDAFRNVIHTKIAPLLIDAMGHLTSVIGAEVARLLSLRRTEPSYLARLSDFLPKEGRLKVFTLNYDCCVEAACRAVGIDVTTGFDPVTKRWNPSLFKKSCRGVNLYKLHSSLLWFPVSDNRRSRCKRTLMELTPDESRQFSTDPRILKCPELILGPGPKVQSDDPFLTLLCEFRKAAQNAEQIIVIGFGNGDPHVKEIIDDAIDIGVSILNVNIQEPNGRYFGAARYRHLMSSAKDALLNGLIANKCFR